MVKQNLIYKANETQKFENGKRVVDQKSTVEFDVLKYLDKHELKWYG